MNKVVKRILIGFGIAAVLVALALPKLSAREKAPAGSPARGAGARALSVTTYVVTPEVLRDRIVTTGSLRANEEVELRSEASGKILKIFFEEGRPVREGQLLVKINDAELQAQRRQTEYRLKLAEDREARQRTLLEKGGISREEYDATVNEVNVLRAGIELIEAQIDKTELKAPFDGVIGLRYVSEGSYISPSTQIATLQDVSPLKVEFSIPERYAGRVRNGSEITFTVEGRQEAFRGQIYAYEPKIEAGTRTLRLRALSPNPDARLVPGGFANVQLVFDEIRDAVAVPAMAVIPELGGKKVFVYKNGKAEARAVETGIRLEDRVQIVSGLAPQDTVITSGIQSLRPGMPVQIAE